MSMWGMAVSATCMLAVVMSAVPLLTILVLPVRTVRRMTGIPMSYIVPRCDSGLVV